MLCSALDDHQRFIVLSLHQEQQQTVTVVDISSVILKEM